MNIYVIFDYIAVFACNMIGRPEWGCILKLEMTVKSIKPVLISGREVHPIIEGGKALLYQMVAAQARLPLPDA